MEVKNKGTINMNYHEEYEKHKEEIERLNELHRQLFGVAYISEENYYIFPKYQIEQMKECIKQNKPCWELYPTDDAEY